MEASSPIIEFIYSLWGDQPFTGYLTIGYYKNGSPYRYKFLKNFDHLDINEIISLNKEQFDICYEIGLQKEYISEKRKRGSENNVISIPGLWCDFDFHGNNHKQKNLPLDLESALKVVINFPLKPSIIVFTGGGIDSYWVFKEPLILNSQNVFNKAKDLSRRFQKTIKQGNENYNEKTSFLNHLLRLPGTKNHERNSIETYVMKNNDNRYNPKDFDQFLIEESCTNQNSDKKSSPLRDLSVKTTQKVCNHGKLEELFQKCKFLQHCKADSRTLSESEWHKMICLLANEYGGYKLIHDLSRDRPSYDPKETDEKIMAVNKNSPAPIRCETLKGLWECGCNCGVTSPVQLLKPMVEEGTSQPISQPIQAPRPPDDEDGDDFAELDVLKDRVPDLTFPWESLPAGLSEALKDLAKAMAVSPEMCSVIALAVLSSAIGNSVEYVEAKKGYTTTVALWVSVIAVSGDKKSPLLERLLKPALDLQHNAVTAFQNQQLQQKSNVTQTAKQKTSQPPSIYTTDPTLEGLIELLSDNTRGILLFQDEISGFLLSFNKYRGGKGGDREAYLSLWNSTPIKVDRVTKNLYLHRPFLALLGGMQPKKAVKVLGDSSFDDGLISRFLFFNHESSFLPLTNHTWSNHNNRLWTDLVTDLYKVPENTFQLTLENDAWELFRNYTNSLEEMRQYLPDRFKVFIPKAITYALRLSGLLHVVDYTIRKTKPNKIISLSTVKNSVELANFFLSQARKMVELYEPKKPRLTKDQTFLIGSILDIHNKRNSFTLPLSEIHLSFNNSISKNAQIKSDVTFGKSIRKALKDLKIGFVSKRIKVDNIKNPVMCLEISQKALNQLKSKIQ